MARNIRWSKRELLGTEDWVGHLGPIRAFTLAQLGSIDKPEQKWQITSHFIPSQHKKKVFNGVEEGKRCAQEIVDKFAQWLASEAGPARGS